MKFIKKFINFFIENQTLIRNNIAIIFYRLGLIPNKYKNRAKVLHKLKKYKKEFFKSKLKFNKLGFYFLDPMPTKDFLEKYYKETYWESRNDKKYPVRLRDVEHYKLLKKIYSDFDSTPKKILNFGAGHGGLSILLHVANHHIYNFDPTGLDNLFFERWHIIKNLNENNIKFDLIYGSHSLEHVYNLTDTMKMFDKSSNQNTIYFFEVPNCYNKNEILPPHTYYFTKNFFENCFDNFDYCQTLSNFKVAKNEDGDVINFLCKSKIKDSFLNK